MGEQPTCPKFIDSAPLGEDLFQSGSQKKTAEGITKHIKNSTSNYRLIGLDGGWGAGKSNVISIVKKLLGETYHVFLYDAWSHQEDLQRRSFLEELTDELQKHHVVDQEEWRDKLKMLLAKKKETIQQTVPRLSYAIIVAFLATVLTPVMTAIAGSVTCPFWKIVIAASPIFTALIIWLFAIRKNKKYKNFLDLFYIYKQQELETITNQIVTENEPSVREFRNWMHDLENSLHKDLIIVFDNMDRLPPDKVQILWSSIHTFFSETTHKKIWVIIPFDRVHITEAFSNDPEKANHFINKTFGVIFRVPPAVLTDWWDFFEIKFKEAFDGGDVRELSIVKGIFDRYQTFITPRKIIAFINELVTLKLTWQNEIKLRYMALFLMNKDIILNDPITTIINKTYRSKVSELFQDDTDVDDVISALVYNVPKETASQVTLQREIVIAIRKNDTELLNKISKHKDFFKILEEIYVKEDMDLESSVRSLDRVVVQDGDGYADEVLNNIWLKLTFQQKNTPIDNLEFTPVQNILLSNCPSTERIALIKYITSRYSTSRNLKGDTFFKAMTDLDGFISSKKWEFSFEGNLRETYMQPQMFVEYLRSAKDQYDKYNVSCNNSQLEAYIIEQVDKDWKEADILQYLKDKFAFPKLKAKIEDIILNDKTDLENVSAILSAYRNLSKDRILSEKMSDEHIDKLLQDAQKKTIEFYELTAMRLARGSEWEGQSSESEEILTDFEDDDVSPIATNIESFKNFGDLVKQTTTWHQPLMASVMKSLILNSTGTSTASVLVLTANFDEIVEQTSVSAAEYVKRIEGWNKPFTNNLTESNLLQSIPSLKFYETCFSTKSKLSEKLFSTATSFIDKIEPERWQQIFEDENCIQFKLLIYFLQTEVIHGIPNKAIDSYKQRLIQIGSETEAITHSTDIWQQLYSSADKRQIKSTLKNVRDNFISNGNINPGLFMFFEEMLRNTASLDERSSDVFRRIITPVIDNKDCLKKIADNGSFYLSLFNSAGDERIDFVKELRQGKEDEMQPQSITDFEKMIDAQLAKYLEIVDASYYTDEEHFADITAKMKHIVGQEGTLHFKIDNGIVDGKDPHPDTPKRLSVKFMFEGKEDSHTYNEGDWINIP